MKRTAIVLGVALIATGAIGVVGTQPVNAQEGVTRTPILKKDLEADPKKEVTMFIAEYKPEARTGKHYHPGQEFIYCIEGQGVLEEAGKPPVELKPGVAIYFQSDRHGRQICLPKNFTRDMWVLLRKRRACDLH